MTELLIFSITFIVLYLLLFVGVLIINYTMATEGGEDGKL